MSAQEARLNGPQARLRLIECKSCHDYLTELSVAQSTMESQKAAIDALTRRLEQMEDGEDLKHAEKEVRKLRRTIGRLNAELSKARKEDPAFADAQEVFDYWRKECRAGSARVKLTDDREKAILKALTHYTKRQLAFAILGAKYAASVGDNGVRYDDIELIARGSKVEAFGARYAAYRARHGLPPIPEVVSDDAG